MELVKIGDKYVNEVPEHGWPGAFLEREIHDNDSGRSKKNSNRTTGKSQSG